jgi:hypothetical protein
VPETPNDKPPREHRQRVLKGATIVISVAKSEISCVVRNQHQHGAELRVPLDSRLPEQFTLYIPTDGIAYTAVLRWRHGEHAGVRFTGTVPKPKHHYG